MGEIFFGLTICAVIIVVLKYFANRYDNNRKKTLPFNLIDFKEAIKNNKLSEINRLGVRLVNNPYLEVNELRIIMLELAEYKKNFPLKKNSLKKVEDTITTRQINWGLFAHRYSDPKEYAEALKDIVNLH